MRKADNWSNIGEMNNRVKGKVKYQKKLLKSKSSLKVQKRNDSNSTSDMSCEINRYHEEYNCYDRAVVDKL